MAKIFRKEVAGPLVRAVCYTMQLPQDSEGTRAEKSKLSGAARQRLNVRTSWEKCRLVVAANFGAADLFVTLTYDDAHLPTNRKAAIQQMNAFFKRLRVAYRLAGAKNCDYLYVTEDKHGAGRLHHHAFLRGIPNAQETVETVWGRGGAIVEPVNPLQLVDLSKYFCKEAADGWRKVGQRLWTPSRGLKKPEVVREYVRDDFTLALPPGAVLIDNPTNRNAYGEFSYIEYWNPGSVADAPSN